jgi:hypothetical protein
MALNESLQLNVDLILFIGCDFPILMEGGQFEKVRIVLNDNT